MTTAELLEGHKTVHSTRLEELHALLDEFHEKQRTAKRPRGVDTDSTVQQYFAASLEQQADASAPRVSIGLNEGKGLLATLDEARRFAYEILALVDQGRAQEWDSGLKRACPEMIPLSHTLSGPVP